MVGLGLLVGVFLQRKWDPGAGVRAATKVQNLLAQMRVMGPYKTRSISELSQQGQRTGWLIQMVSGDRDLYEAFVGEYSGPIQVTRGYLGYNNRDLPKAVLLPGDSPLVLNFADYLLDQLSKRQEVGEPSLTQYADNSFDLRVPIRKNGIPFGGPADSYCSVRFRPDAGAILEIYQSHFDLPVNASQPSLSGDIARLKAHKALREKIFEKQEIGAYVFDRAELTEEPTLANYRGFLSRSARLAWCFPYKVTYKEKPSRKKVFERVGGPTYAPTQGILYIDACTGAFLGHIITQSSMLATVVASPSTVGKYAFIDATKWDVSFVNEEFGGDPDSRYELFMKIKSGG